MAGLGTRQSPFALAIHGGDVTSSAQATQFLAAKLALDELVVEYLPTMGNHGKAQYCRMHVLCQPGLARATNLP